MFNHLFRSFILGVTLLAFTQGALGSEKSQKASRKPASSPDRNVQVGGSDEFDACGGSGVVTATTTLFTRKDGVMHFGKVEVSQRAFSCDEEGDFVGIVFGSPDQNCGVGSPIPRRQDYKGPCKSGWIKKQYYELLAG